MELDVKGHSGCDIRVEREADGMYVYKTTRDPGYLDRLVLQAEKQRAAALPELQHIRVPRVHAIDRSEGMVSVKMDYVYSRNFVEYFEHAGFEQVRYLIAALIKYIEREIQASPLATVPAAVVAGKFADVRSKTLANPALANPALAADPEVASILERSAAVLEPLGDMLIPLGTCHGDLTFSNILFNGNNYYLIDFLDSFIESPLLDIVKLRQDTAWLWSPLMYTHPCDNIRLRIAFGAIDAELHDYFAKRYEWYGRYYAPLQLMNFLRVLQYARDPAVIQYLKRVINEQLQEF